MSVLKHLFRHISDLVKVTLDEIYVFGQDILGLLFLYFQRSLDLLELVLH
jgi:hypothetical protein